MIDYLVQVTYTPEAVATLIAELQNREEVMRSIVEKFGG